MESEDPDLDYTPEIKDVMIRWRLDNPNSNQNPCTMKWKKTNETTYTSDNAVKDPLYEKVYYYNFTLDPSAQTYLDLDTKYDYEVYIENVKKAEGTFMTPPLPDETNVTFYAYGDTRSNHTIHNIVCSKIVEEISDDASSQTLLLHAGDWINQDTEDDWQNQYFNLQSDMAIQLRSLISTMGVLGNHEDNGNIYKNTDLTLIIILMVKKPLIIHLIMALFILFMCS